MAPGTWPPPSGPPRVTANMLFVRALARRESAHDEGPEPICAARRLVIHTGPARSARRTEGLGVGRISDSLQICWSTSYRGRGCPGARVRHPVPSVDRPRPPDRSPRPATRLGPRSGSAPQSRIVWASDSERGDKCAGMRSARRSPLTRMEILVPSGETASAMSATGILRLGVTPVDKVWHRDADSG